MFVDKRRNSRKRTATTATEVRNIVIVNCVVCTGHCSCGVVVRKKKTAVGATLKKVLLLKLVVIKVTIKKATYVHLTE